MAQGLGIFSGDAKNKFAKTIHPGDSASQMSSNMLHDPNEADDGLSAKQRMILVKESEASKGTTVSARSMKPETDVGIADEFPVACSSRSSGRKSTISNTSSMASTARESTTFKDSLPVLKEPECILAFKDAPLETSKASTTKSPHSSASKSTHTRSTTSSTSKVDDPVSTMSKASSTKSSRVSSRSRGSRHSGKSRSLMLVSKAQRKGSPLQNEVTLKDLDDVYSLSIHERGPLANMPSRDELLAQILHKQPEMDFDEASVIVDNQIATASRIRCTTTESCVSTPENKFHSSSEPKSGVSGAQGKSLMPPPSTVGSKSPTKSSGSQSSSLTSKTQLPPTSEYESELRSTSSKTSSVKGKDPESIDLKSSSSSGNALMPSTQELIACDSSLKSNPLSPPNVLVIPATGISSLLGTASSSLFCTENSSSLPTDDLLAVAHLRTQRELQRAQAVASFEASRSNLDCASRNRLVELELAKQSLEDSRTLTRLQELGIHDDKLATLARYAHEDQLSALARAESAEADRRNAKFTSALREKEAQERARLRERRSETAKEERRKQDERDIELQKEYERMDHDQKMEKIDSFGRLVDAATPRNAPQPRSSGLEMGYSYGYNNPVTGGDGTVRMHVGKGCVRSGTGECPKCLFSYREHPLKQHADGSITGRRGKILRLASGESRIKRASPSSLKR